MWSSKRFREFLHISRRCGQLSRVENYAPASCITVEKWFLYETVYSVHSCAMESHLSSWLSRTEWSSLGTFRGGWGMNWFGVFHWGFFRNLKFVSFIYVDSFTAKFPKVSRFLRIIKFNFPSTVAISQLDTSTDQRSYIVSDENMSLCQDYLWNGNVYYEILILVALCPIR